MVLSMKRVTYSYNSFTLGPIDLNFSTGYIYAIIGANGSGKTTLLQLITNILVPHSGSISLFDLHYPDHEKEIKSQIGYVPSRYLGYKSWTAKNLESIYRRLYPKWNLELFHSLIDEFQVSQQTSYNQLSEGAKQKLLFSLAVSVDPNLLVLDEPTNGFDVLSKNKFQQQINNWMGSGNRSVIIATHNLDEIQKIADYILLIDQGQLLGIYEKDQLRERWGIVWLKEPLSQNPTSEIVRVEGNQLISSQVKQTISYLNENGVEIWDIQNLSLEEIVMEMVQSHRKKIQLNHR